ncbi:uncharacterized protein PHACADRAFT_212658 [Phanerochaete carnosa HHB-10118-sp]|uniref:AB hydrolase-1 domain-containing protein n=1 Tax=Phanerochaete carnosa (strain HHB-10118-sp) TaxID=650164 RepID=K5WP09_PHACS|nr:uncharacterized protein PHACADRAFT_212658 [Phanerochaete carnosa HHB-10118-sp]EKM52062.1 hypothetical protein PHACADRAFT_212658 [Phanerochaete carnosa HHB-10118-sp]
MPFARIDEKGTTLYYTDSGVPSGVQDYTTVVLIHGATINGGIFERMFPHASKYGLRLIAMNMRDYTGSTPYTLDELSEFTRSDIEVQASALRNFGREFACFLVYVCQSLGIPATTTHEGKMRGGLAFLTWSLGNLALLSFFGDPRTLDSEQKTVLQPYLRTVFAYDPPSGLYGADLDVGQLPPYSDPAIPVGDKPAAFGNWVTGYFTAVSDLAHITPENLLNRKEEQLPTLRAMSPDDSERIFEPGNLVRLPVAISHVPQSVYERHFRRTFLDADVVLPGVNIVALWCDRSVYTMVWSAKVLHELLQEQLPPGQRMRNTSLIKLENANHVYQWDEPERLVQILHDNI